jgi:hypothetical protein
VATSAPPHIPDPPLNPPESDVDLVPDAFRLSNEELRVLVTKYATAALAWGRKYCDPDKRFNLPYGQFSGFKFLVKCRNSRKENHKTFGKPDLYVQITKPSRAANIARRGNVRRSLLQQGLRSIPDINRFFEDVNNSNLDVRAVPM